MTRLLLTTLVAFITLLSIDASRSPLQIWWYASGKLESIAKSNPGVYHFIKDALDETAGFFAKIVTVEWDRSQSLLNVDVCRNTPGSCQNMCKNSTPMTYSGGQTSSVNYIFSVTVETKGGRIGCKPTTLALALNRACYSKSSGRPLFGEITICKKNLDTSFKEGATDFMIQTLKHEMLHALVFSEELFSRFPGGTTKTVGNQVVKWKTLNKMIIKNFTTIITPNVVKVVREHFACPDAKGAPLEDEGGSGTERNHWEKSFFGPELMTGVISAYARFTRLSFELMLDSGWYNAADHAYDYLDNLDYGRGKGCQFLLSSCLGYSEYIESHKQEKNTTRTWCTPKDVGNRIGGGSNRKQLLRCTADRRAIESCDITDDKAKCPNEKRLYYEKFCSSDKCKTYCPSWESTRSTILIGSKLHSVPRVCIHNATKDVVINDHGELFGESSACFQTSAGKATSFQLIICSVLGKVAGSTTLTPYEGAGCYEYRCYKGRIQVKARGDFLNRDRYLTCWAEGAKVRIRRQMKSGNDIYTVRGEIICPSCVKLCEGKGFQCAPDVEGINAADFFDTRCGACKSAITTKMLVMIVVFSFVALM